MLIGKTIKEALRDLREKIFEYMDVEEKIEEFKNTFKDNKKYKIMEFYRWHNILTGSCEMGRKSFARNHNLDLSKDKLTVKEFIELTENDYGGEIIKRLKEFYREERNK